MTKFLETFFRHKWWFVLPPLLITIAVSYITVSTAPVIYLSTAGIWVDRPTYLAYNDNWNQWASPAQNQTARLQELLKTETFVVDVANRTSLSSLTKSQRGMEQLYQLLTQGLTVTPVGTHLVTVAFRSENPRVSYELLTAIVNGFNDNLANDQVNQAGLATDFYSDQLTQAQDDLTKASDNLRRYIQSNPSLSQLQFDASSSVADFSSASTAAPRPGAADPKAILDQASTTDSQLQQLRSQVQQAQAHVVSIQQSLQSAEFQASASVQGQQLGFQVLDAPTLPTSGGRDLKKRVMYPIGSFVGSLAVSMLILVLMSVSNRSVQSESDLATNVRVIADIPYLRLKRVPKMLSRMSTRQAIGFVAGTALPAPKGGK